MNMRLTIISATLFLAARQGSSTVRDTAGANRFIQLEGASVVLKQTLMCHAAKPRVFLQDGQVSAGFDSYRPHCAFEIKSVQHDGFRLRPTPCDKQVQTSLQQVVSAEPVRVAGLRLRRRRGDRRWQLIVLRGLPFLVVVGCPAGRAADELFWCIRSATRSVPAYRGRDRTGTGWDCGDPPPAMHTA